jgi:DNA-binding NarL/FixJ family response regulator
MVAVKHYSPPAFSKLTVRERDVMRYITLGKPNKVIASQLGVSQRTIESHRARIFLKLRVKNAVELTRCVLEGGELPPMPQRRKRGEK